jgi:hypothetical protein
VTVYGHCIAVGVGAVTAALTVAACSHTVAGTATRPLSGVGEPGRSYGYIDDRCGMLVDSSVQQLIGAQDVVRPYSGAVCQYVMNRQSTIVDATFSWFETGSLERERALAASRGAQISDIDIGRSPAFLARRSVTGVGCSATASADPGVLSWWVQFRGQTDGDPCEDAKKLLAATLSAEL